MTKRLIVLLLVISGLTSSAQKKCRTADYTELQLSETPSLRSGLMQIEEFTKHKISITETNQRSAQTQVNGLIKIPVVFHVLYHLPEENIPASLINDMMTALNRDFRRKNSDTVNTPAVFKPFAADMEIEFQLATMDPQGRSTSGVERKYTPVKYWLSDDKMKFASNYGADAWDSRSYLNIWICNMKDVFGYSTLPGLDKKKDGVVFSLENFSAGYITAYAVNDHRTLVHEVGHWLNLRHIWGDSFCGDDFVDDTPKQSIYTSGCPSGTRQSCSNGVNGDMYMNYMDFTQDPCMNMFTRGQKARARALFETGGPRNSFLVSKGLNTSLVQAAALPDFYPKWLEARVYPNPSSSVINIYFEYDERWIGRELQVMDMSGRIIATRKITSVIPQIDVSRLSAGVYIIRAEKDDEKLQAKFIKN
jgi:hypothetical protein